MIKTLFQTMSLTAFAIIGITVLSCVKAEDPYSQCMDACQNTVNKCRSSCNDAPICIKDCIAAWHKCNDNCAPKLKKK